MLFSDLKAQMIVLADDPAITTSQAAIWINTNYRLLLREYEWPFMVGSGTYTVTSGTQETAFTALSITDFAKPLRVWIASSSTANKTPLKPIRYEERNTPGLDGYYYITPSNLKIGLVATPTNSTNVVTVDYLKTTTDLDDTVNTTPVFVSDFHWIVVWKALMMYQFQQREQSDEFRVQYEEMLASMISFYKMTQAASTPVLSRGIYTNPRFGTADPLHMS